MNSFDRAGGPPERTAAGPIEPDPAGATAWRKLVSHRLRGFGPDENGSRALRRACASPVPYLEIDTRVAADGRIFVHHNPYPSPARLRRLRFALADSDHVRRLRYRSGEGLLELEEAFAVFAARRCREQRLCIDMKDCGFEADHLALAMRFRVEASVSWMSWVPESLFRLRALGASGPLILAHCNLLRFSALGSLLHGACARLELRMSHIVLRGAHHAHRLPHRAHGFQHGLICTRLPAAVERLLAECGGGVCVHRSLLSGALRRYCRDAGLQLWVFRAPTPAAYARFAVDRGIDMVFCDDAPGVLRAETATLAGECYAT